MTPASLVFGAWDPKEVVEAAKKYVAVTTVPAAAMVPVTLRGVGLGSLEDPAVPGFRNPTAPQPGQELTEQQKTAVTAFLAAVGGLLVVLLLIRGAMGWYIGKQFGMPKSGAIVGGLFGAPGLGVLALLPGDKR